MSGNVGFLTSSCWARERTISKNVPLSTIQSLFLNSANSRNILLIIRESSETELYLIYVYRKFLLLHLRGMYQSRVSIFSAKKMSMLSHYQLPISWRNYVGSGGGVFEIAGYAHAKLPLYHSPRRIPEFYIKNACICICRQHEGWANHRHGTSETGLEASRWRVWHISCRNVSLRMHRNVGHDFRMPAVPRVDNLDFSI
jgi:hypothetical protein